MNLDLAGAFCQNYPEQLLGKFDCLSTALVVSFNRRGTLLAVGCNDGHIVIWDLATHCIAKTISAHVHPICSLSWSRSGRRLMSSSTDSNVCIWNVITSDCLKKYRFPYPPLFAQFDPKNEMEFLVCPLQQQALFIDKQGQHRYVPLGEDNDRNIIAVFDRKGRHVYLGNSKGTVQILSIKNFNTVAQFKISYISNVPISVRSIEFSRKGKYFLVNCSDRIIRLYSIKDVLENKEDKEVEPLAKLQDLINKSMWKKCTFSGDGELICAGTVGHHSIYIWERSSGILAKILHGAKVEILLDVDWHPYKPIIASIGSGIVSIWAQNPVESWSAFAPNFKELDENCEYDEPESEFDERDEDKSVVTAKKQNDTDDEFVDVTTVSCGSSIKNSDEESDHCEVDILPLVPEIEHPEVMQTMPPKIHSSSRRRMEAHSLKRTPEYPRVETIDTPTKSGLKLKIKFGRRRT